MSPVARLGWVLVELGGSLVDSPVLLSHTTAKFASLPAHNSTQTDGYVIVHHSHSVVAATMSKQASERLASMLRCCSSNLIEEAFAQATDTFSALFFFKQAGT